MVIVCLKQYKGELDLEIFSRESKKKTGGVMERPAFAKPHLQIILQNKALEQIIKKSSRKENLAPKRP